MPRCAPQRQSQNTLLPPARISFSASPQNDVLFAISAPTCSTYSCQLFSISSLNSCGSVPSRKPCWRFSGWYTTRSETSARARRRAFCFGSCTMKGFTGRSGPVMRWPGGALGAALGGGGGAAAGAAGRAGGVAAGARTGAVGDAGGRSVGVFAATRRRRLSAPRAGICGCHFTADRSRFHRRTQNSLAVLECLRKKRFEDILRACGDRGRRQPNQRKNG